MSGGDTLRNPTAEAALLGALLLRPELIVQMSDRVTPDDFADPLHGRIFKTMQRFAATGKACTPITLRPIFASDSDANYGDYLDELVAEPALAGSSEALADQIAELAGRRLARTALQDALTALTEEFDKPVDEITGTVESVGWAAARRIAPEPLYNTADFVQLVLDRDDRIRENPTAIGLVNDLVPEFEKALGPLEEGTYNVLAGRPGMGKSSVARTLALAYGLKGHAGIYFQHEMTAEQMALCSTTDLAYHMGFDFTHEHLKKGNLHESDRAALRKVSDAARAIPVQYLTPGPCDVRRVWSMVAQQKGILAAAGRKLEFVIIDYMQLLGATDVDGRYIAHDTQRVNQVSKTIKRLCHEFGVAVIALAQLSRGVEQRPNKRPILSDLKSSGDIEQDADSVTLLYREEYYLEQSKPKMGEKDSKGVNLYEEWEALYGAARNKMELIVAKNRHGFTTSRTVRFLPKHSAVRGMDFDHLASDTTLF